MDYVKEITAFYDWIELHHLSPSAMNLWYALLHIHHRTGWQESFVVNEMVLCLKTNLSGRTLRKARSELKEMGRIDFISQKGKAPTYRMIPFQLQLNNAEEPSLSEEKVFDYRISEKISDIPAKPCTAARAELHSTLYRQNRQTKKQQPIG